MRRKALLAALLLALGGCTLRPLYAGGSDGPVVRALEAVQVAPIEGRAGGFGVGVVSLVMAQPMRVPFATSRSGCSRITSVAVGSFLANKGEPLWHCLVFVGMTLLRGRWLSERDTPDVILINEALARLEEGSYGYCFECGDEIAQPRLRAHYDLSIWIDCTFDTALERALAELVARERLLETRHDEGRHAVGRRPGGQVGRRAGRPAPTGGGLFLPEEAAENPVPVLTETELNALIKDAETPRSIVSSHLRGVAGLWRAAYHPKRRAPEVEARRTAAQPLPGTVRCDPSLTRGSAQPSADSASSAASACQTWPEPPTPPARHYTTTKRAADGRE